MLSDLSQQRQLMESKFAKTETNVLFKFVTNLHLVPIQLADSVAHVRLDMLVMVLQTAKVVLTLTNVSMPVLLLLVIQIHCVQILLEVILVFAMLDIRAMVCLLQLVALTSTNVLHKLTLVI